MCELNWVVVCACADRVAVGYPTDPDAYSGTVARLARDVRQGCEDALPQKRQRLSRAAMCRLEGTNPLPYIPQAYMVDHYEQRHG